MKTFRFAYALIMTKKKISPPFLFLAALVSDVTVCYAELFFLPQNVVYIDFKVANPFKQSKAILVTIFVVVLSSGLISEWSYILLLLSPTRYTGRRESSFKYFCLYLFCVDDVNCCSYILF